MSYSFVCLGLAAIAAERMLSEATETIADLRAQLAEATERARSAEQRERNLIDEKKCILENYEDALRLERDRIKKLKKFAHKVGDVFQKCEFMSDGFTYIADLARKVLSDKE